MKPTSDHGEPLGSTADGGELDRLDAEGDLSTAGTAAPGADPADVFLDLGAVAARYRIGRSKAYELLEAPGFPMSVVPGMKRIPLVALRVWERATALAAVPSDGLGVAAPPPARRAGRPVTNERQP